MKTIRKPVYLPEELAQTIRKLYEEKHGTQHGAFQDMLLRGAELAVAELRAEAAEASNAIPVVPEPLPPANGLPTLDLQWTEEYCQHLQQEATNHKFGTIQEFLEAAVAFYLSPESNAKALHLINRAMDFVRKAEAVRQAKADAKAEMEKQAKEKEERAIERRRKSGRDQQRYTSEELAKEVSGAEKASGKDSGDPAARVKRDGIRPA